MPQAHLSQPHLRVERCDGVMTLSMNRPEVGNALTPLMLILLARAGYEFRDSAILRGFELYEPVVRAINGSALGGGTAMIQATDIHFNLLEDSRPRRSS